MERTSNDGTGAPSTRRNEIAAAGIGIIAQRGVRALTHRAVDEEAHLPPGSTSYYTRTRRALIDEIVRVLAEHSIADLEDAAHTFSVLDRTTESTAREAILDALVESVHSLARRPDELKVRCALLLELEPDDAARATLTERSPVLQQIVQRVTDALNTAGIAATTDQATDLMGLCDALLMRAVITGMPAQITPILSAYIRGLLDLTSETP